MMGTLATALARRKIPTPEDRYVANVEGDIENVNNVLKITEIRVNYSLKVEKGKAEEVKEAFSRLPPFLSCGTERDRVHPDQG